MKKDTEWIYGKHALITGASDGIGRELARNLVGKCRKLTLVARRPEKLHETEKELSSGTSQTEIRTYSMDVCDTEKMKYLINTIYKKDKDQVDIFINCAGGMHVIEPFEEMNYSDIEKIFDTNAKAPIFWLRELLPHMKNNPIEKDELKRGHIIMMSSRSAERALPKFGVYASAKGAVDKFIEAMQREYAQYRLVFTLVGPGSINTAFTEKWSKKDRDAHNMESMSLEEAITPILQALKARYATNRISYESTAQWLGELGVLKND